MDEIIKVCYDNADRPTVLARDLHKMLVVPTPYDKWFDRMRKYGFVENVDFVTVDKKVYRADGTEMPQTQHDHQITIPMAKELCMIQRTEKGKQMRQYFIAVEERWNSPDAVMARLFAWLRDHGYLIKRKGTDYNMPTQRAMEVGLFEVKQTCITHADGHVTVSKTPKVTGKGQIYFVNKIMAEATDTAPAEQ